MGHRPLDPHFENALKTLIHLLLYPNTKIYLRFPPKSNPKSTEGQSGWQIQNWQAPWRYHTLAPYVGLILLAFRARKRVKPFKPSQGRERQRKRKRRRGRGRDRRLKIELTHSKGPRWHFRLLLLLSSN